MPTYEYECQKCQHRFEAYQSMKDAPLRKCPKCRGRVKRLLGMGMGVIFKGSGFYTTDYRKPGYAEAAKKDKPASADAPKTKESTGTKPSAVKESSSKD